MKTGYLQFAVQLQLFDDGISDILEFIEIQKALQYIRMHQQRGVGFFWVGVGQQAQLTCQFFGQLCRFGASLTTMRTWFLT